MVVESGLARLGPLGGELPIPAREFRVPAPARRRFAVQGIKICVLGRSRPDMSVRFPKRGSWRTFELKVAFAQSWWATATFSR